MDMRRNIDKIISQREGKRFYSARKLGKDRCRDEWRSVVNHKDGKSSGKKPGRAQRAPRGRIFLRFFMFAIAAARIPPFAGWRLAPATLFAKIHLQWKFPNFRV